MNEALIKFLVSLPLGGPVVRRFVAKAAIAAAIAKHEPEVKAFKDANIYLEPISEAHKGVAIAFQEIVRTFRDNRDKEMATLRQQRIQKPQISVDVDSLSNEVKIDNKAAFMKSAKKTLQHKLRHAAKHAIKEKLEAARLLHAMGTGAVAGGAAGAGVAFSDEYKGHIDTLTEQAFKAVQPELDKLEEFMVSALDASGAVDIAVGGIQIGEEALKSVFGDQAADMVKDHISVLVDSAHQAAPYLTEAKDILSEIGMLMDGEGDLGSAILEGGGRVGAHMLGLKIGLILEAATLGATMGGCVILCTFASRMLSNGVLNSVNKERVAEYNQLFEEIRIQYGVVQSCIDGIADIFDTEYQRRVELYPNITDEEHMKAWLDDLSTAYNNGLRTSEEALKEKAVLAVQAIPKNTEYENVLKFDRRALVRNMYLKAQREITDIHTGVNAHFNLARSIHGADALAFIIKHPHFNTQETHAIFDRMERVANDSSSHYLALRTEWQEDLSEFGDVEGKKAIGKMNGEARAFDAFKAARKPRMEKLKKSVERTNKRLGLKASPA